jgi:S-(hydroxymethyl)glutathione dehydrogenase/alcohol dehydrogenase
MRAAVLTEVNKPLQILDLEQEGPKAGEVRVQVKAAGVCLSDYHIMNGDWPLPLPMVLGHEAAGIVVELGQGVTHVKKGDHIIFSFRPNCGHCRYCAQGRSVICNGHDDSARLRMHDGTSRVKLNGEPVNQMARIGTFSEYVVCPAEQVVAVRKDLPWTHAAIIGCSVATGVGAAIRHAKVESGSTVLVVGCGGVGLNVVQGAKLAGAQTIIACDLLDNKLGYAREFGATHVINAKKDDTVKAVKDLTGGLGVDYAFDAIGGAKTMETWSPPGGHLDFGETPETCAAREAQEEVGLEVRGLQFRGVTNDVFEESKQHYITLWLEAGSFSGDPVIVSEEEVDEIGWFRWDDLPQPLFRPLDNYVNRKNFLPK